MDIEPYSNNIEEYKKYDVIIDYEKLPADSCYEIDDISKVERLFEGWQETMIYSCLQRVMGKIYVTDPDAPASAMAVVGCFAFFAGEPNRELVKNKPDGFAIMVPSSEGWASLIEECIPSARRVTRYAIKKDTRFDKEALKANTSLLPVGYEIREIDGNLYDKCLENPLTYDFVSSFDDKEVFLKDGRGMVIIKNGDIVAGASSYSRYKEGIEIEVDTVPSERRKHFATIVCSALILRCLDEGLYPSWDAQNLNSVHLAEKLGYEFDHEYTAYELRSIKMKALVINCSPVRTGATAEIVKIVSGELSERYDVKSICIDDYAFAFCKGCRSCHNTAKCVMKDAPVIREILNEFDEADIIVSVAPSYWADIPGQYKAFIDRCTPWCNTHEPHAMIKPGKKGYAIALRTGPNMPECERIIGSIEHFYGHLEIESVGHLGLTSIEYKENVEPRRQEILDFCRRI